MGLAIPNLKNYNFHCGQATVGLTDRIFTRVESQEAAAVGRSQFMMDLCQVASMLRLATARCALNLVESQDAAAATVWRPKFMMDLCRVAFMLRLAIAQAVTPRAAH